ncbi:MAG: hypothetical protein ACRCY9_16955, partial [Phycicoccus sp.]
PPIGDVGAPSAGRHRNTAPQPSVRATALVVLAVAAGCGAATLAAARMTGVLVTFQVLAILPAGAGPQDLARTPDGRQLPAVDVAVTPAPHRET